MTKRRPYWSPSPRRSIWLLVTAVCILLFALDAAVTWDDRQVQLRQVRTETANLGRSLAEHAQSSMHLADAVLLNLRDEVEARGTSAPQLAALQQLIGQRLAAVPLLRGLAVCDEHGEALARSADPGGPGLNFADRDYFRRHRDSAERGPFIGPPVASKVDGTWVVTVSRRLDHADGSFAGVVVGFIPVTFFQSHYASFDVGTQGVIMLVGADAAIIARQPFIAGAVGTSLANGVTFREHLPRARAGNVEYTATLDGTVRLSSYRLLDDYPLVVMVARSRAEALAEWQAETWTHLAGVTLAALLILDFGRRLAAQIRERERAERMNASWAAEYRLLTANMTDVVARLGTDLKRTYVSPGCQHLLGYAPEELIGRGPKFTAHPDDWPIVDAAFAAMKAAAEPVREVFQYRGLRRDGTVVWIEACGQRLDPEQGYVVACRDISLRKQAEQQLEAMSREDGLTRLANRRGFDEALEKEFQRAARSAAPLALVMIDVDRFKSFNDRYGHQAGDACLRAIAATIGGAFRRPGDLTARYGGEELAVLLPDVAIDGAGFMAARLREAVCELAIPHADSPSGIVTISLGVASTFPGRGPATPADLVKAADDALYAAKHGGRNTIRFAGGAFAAERPALGIPLLT